MGTFENNKYLLGVALKTRTTKGLLDIASVGTGLTLGIMDAKGNSGESLENYLTHVPATLHGIVGGFFGFFSDFCSNVEDSNVGTAGVLFDTSFGAGANYGISLLETKLGYYVGRSLGSLF